MLLPILYSFRRCPYAIRARMAILVSGFSVEVREVSLANKPQEMLAASPKGTVPVIVLPDGKVLEQSLDIMAYALGRNDPHNWLSPEAEANMSTVTLIDTKFKAYLDGYKYPDRHGNAANMHRNFGFAILQGLDATLARQEYLAGTHFSLIDAAIFPFVRQFAAVDQDWFGAQPIPALQTWLNRIGHSDLFQAVMVSFPVWQASDGVTLFPATKL